jgi:hypothetical protein
VRRSGSLIVAVGLLAGCGQGDSAPVATVTRTVVEPSPVTEPSRVTASPPPVAVQPASDVTGRGHDVGTVVDVLDDQDGPVVLLVDRWTVLGVDDAVLARDGVPLEPTTRDRFTNQNTERTYRVPVAADPQVVVNTCVPPQADGASAGLVSRPASLEEFLRLPGRESLLVAVAYAGGELVRLDTVPLCD